MRKADQVLLPGAEIILALLEGMPHDAVAAGGPVEGSGGSHAAIRPAVLVLNGNHLPLVGKTAVLHAAAVEIFIRLRFQGKAGAALFKRTGAACSTTTELSFRLMILRREVFLSISILIFPVVMVTTSPCWSTSRRETGFRGLSARMRASGSALGSRIMPPLSSRKIRKTLSP